MRQLKAFIWLCCLAVSLIITNEINGQKECVIIVQGYEEPDETFASNGSDSAEEAFKNFPGGAKVTKLRPSGSNKSKKPGTEYSNKANLINQLKAALCDKECENVVLIFIGHGMGGSGGIEDPPPNNEAGGMWVGEEGKPAKSTFIEAEEVAKLIDECKKEVKLIDIHCYASAMYNGIYAALKNKDLIKIGLSSSKWNEKSTFTWPDNDKTKQFYEFLRHFLEDYYKIIGDPNVMKQINGQAEELKEKAEEENKKREEEREKLRKEIEEIKKELEDCNKKKDKLEGELEDLEKEAKKLEQIVKDLQNLINLIDEHKKLVKEEKKWSKTEENIAVKEIKQKYNNIWNGLPKGQKTAEKKKELAEQGSAEIKETRKEYKENREEYKKKKEENEKARKKAKDNLKSNGVSVSSSTSDSNKSKLQKKLNQKNKDKEEADKKVEDKEKEIKEKEDKIKELQDKIKELKEKLDAITDLSVAKPVMELVLHYSFISAKANTKTSNPEQPKSPVPKGSSGKGGKESNNSGKNKESNKNKGKEKAQGKVELPKKKLKTVEFKKKVKGGSEEYWIRFYKVTNKETGDCVVVGYQMNSFYTPIRPIKSIKCKKDCSMAEFSIKEGGKDIIFKIEKQSNGTYKATVDGEKREYKELAYFIPFNRRGKRTEMLAMIANNSGDYSFSIGSEQLAGSYDDSLNSGYFTYTGDEFNISFNDHGEVNFGSNGQEWSNQDTYRYSLYQDDVRIGEASFVVDGNTAKGSLWIEKNDQVLSLSGWYNDYSGEFNLKSPVANYPVYTIRSTDFTGKLESSWSHSLKLNYSPLIEKVDVLPFISDLKNEGIQGPNSVPKLSWTMNTEYLGATELSNLAGVRVAKYNHNTERTIYFDLEVGENSFTDPNVTSNTLYTYRVSAASLNNNTCECGCEDNPHYYSYSESIDWQRENENEEKRDKSIMPLIAGGAAVVGGTLAILNDGDDKIEGCTDPNSCKYNPEATVDDGSCLYLDCIGDCGGPVMPGAPCNDGDDCTVNDVIDANCECNGIFEDADGDGICDSEDFCPELDNSFIGTSCDDGDPCTINDLYAPSCECEGTYTDSDGDGVCDAEDQCPGLDDNLIGTSCDDGDPCTDNDIYGSNCECEGIYTDSDGDGICDGEDSCPELDNSLIGTTCDDGDDCTVNDTWLISCDCVGTFVDSDNDGVCDADDLCPGFNDNLIGTACDDGDVCTEGDVYTLDCECTGTFMDDDGDGVCNAEDQCPGLDDNLIGSPCDDDDDCTINDTWLASCDCAGTYVDSDNDGFCDAEDICPGFDDNLIGTPCDDGNDCTINDVYSSSCDCLGTPIDSDGDGICDADDQCPGFDDNLIGTSCDDGDDCTINDLYNASCECEGTYSDTDGDGICDADDQCPGFDDNLIGTNCNDGDDCTLNDIYNPDCNCAGIFIDSDNDGVCDAEDQCPGINDNLIGNPCDDGDDCTVNDQFNSNCECAGIFLDSDNDGVCDPDDQCPGFNDALIGTACDDGDPCTLSDIYQTNCNCEGIFLDSDSDGICDADDQCPGFDDNLIGTSCSDGDSCTINDVYQNDCNCAGAFQDSDGDGVCDAEDQCPGLNDGLIGSACDDGDACTINDTYLPDCSCTGTFQDSDGDGVCDAEDQCPGFDNNLIGSPCDDGNDCTINDMIGILCNCGGSLLDEDNDGVCDTDDICPGFDDNLIGQPCDDGDSCTVNDVWTTSCNCEGTVLNYNANIETTDTFCELDNGAATVTMSPPGTYQYIWDFLPGTETVLNLTPGLHQLEVIDLSTGCSTSYGFNINQGTMPELFVVTNLVPDPGDGTGMIVIELNNVYNGPYQVCWQGQSVGGNGCDFPLTNGPYTIMGVSDFYNVQVQIFNGAPVPCIHQELIPIPGANAIQEEPDVLDKISLRYTNTGYSQSHSLSSERVLLRNENQLQSQGGIQLLYAWNENYRVGLQLTADIFRSMQPRAGYVGPVFKWVPWRETSARKWKKL